MTYIHYDLACVCLVRTLDGFESIRLKVILCVRRPQCPLAETKDLRTFSVVAVEIVNRKLIYSAIN